MARPLRKTLTLILIVLSVRSPVGVEGIDTTVRPHVGTIVDTGSTPVTSTTVKPRPKPTPRWLQRASRSSMKRIPLKWHRLAYCESRMRIHANRDNTYYGLWQIHKGWFRPFNIDPTRATITQQYKVALHVYDKQGASAWSCARKANFH